mmetsp:Transcript_78849/g.225870  ORF Transcript_78849/g.225870 Transcript_78849/m.225870 type:complete len:302 (-) Transcript_78849:64-969(-)
MRSSGSVVALAVFAVTASILRLRLALSSAFALRSSEGMAGLRRAAALLEESPALRSCPTVRPRVLELLERWHNLWWNDTRAMLVPQRWYKEVEECAQPLEWVLSSLDQRPAAVVDVGAGKGIFSMLLSHLAPPDSLHQLLLLDDRFLPTSAVVRRRGVIDAKSLRLANETSLVPLELWQANAFDSAVADRCANLAGQHGRLVFVGIHLCDFLALRTVELFNRAGHELILAPCCVPGKGNSVWRSGLADGFQICGDDIQSAPFPQSRWTRSLLQAMEGSRSRVRVPMSHSLRPKNLFLRSLK